mgnify:CR=1 FL=1
MSDRTGLTAQSDALRLYRNESSGKMTMSEPQQQINIDALKTSVEALTAIKAHMAECVTFRAMIEKMMEVMHGRISGVKRQLVWATFALLGALLSGMSVLISILWEYRRAIF